SGIGVAFNYDPLKSGDSVVLNFNGTNGYHPQGNLIQASNGLLYGMAAQGGLGSNDWGAVFSYNLFTGQDSILFYLIDTINGASPFGSLLQASNGLLYGMTSKGGKHNKGVLFCYSPLTGRDSILLNFNDTNGAYPYGNL